MSPYQGEQDPRTNPHTAPVFSWGSINQPYAERSIMALVSFIVIVLGVFAFFGWYIFGYDDTNQKEQSSVRPAEMQQAQTEQNTQMPGNRYAEDSGRSGVYDFFYQMFAGIDDGMEDGPLNAKEAEWVQDMEIETDRLFGDTPPQVVVNADPEDLNITNDDVREVRYEVKEEYFDGKVFDYEGHIIGNVSVVKYDDGEAQSFNFTLKEALVPEGKPKRYSIPEDKVKVVQQDGVFFIQLNKEQTEGLAAALYNDQTTAAGQEEDNTNN